MKRLMLIVAAMAMLIGCSGKKKDADKDKKPVSATIDAGAAAVAKPDPAKEQADVPTPADFEDEANKEITKDNLKDEVKKMEDELPEE